VHSTLVLVEDGDYTVEDLWLSRKRLRDHMIVVYPTHEQVDL